jgi:hypothetical protein
MALDTGFLYGNIVGFPYASNWSAKIALCGKDKCALCIHGTPLEELEYVFRYRDLASRCLRLAERVEDRFLAKI